MKRLAPLFVLMASVLWGSMGIITRYVAAIGFNTRQTAAVRITSAAVVLILFLLITDRSKLKICKEDFKWFLGTGLGSLFINNLAYAATVQRASLSVAVVLLYTAPFFVMIMSVLFFKEKLTIQKIIALFLSFAGSILVVGLSGANVGDNVIITLLIGLSAGFGYSLYSIFGKVLMGRYESLTVTVYTFILASLAALVIAEPVSMVKIIAANTEKMPVTVIGSVITLALPYICYSAALKYIESSKASIIASFEVVAASLFGVFLYHEPLDLFNIVGIVCVVAALVILQLKPRSELEIS
ncbi:DMT family transporter [Extibacter muris]|uniref:DMT family transporter n=1 Tax=Extibacter muris TaxID=1796622 RepID=UPI001D081813|nr:DMT family transporter [Extibacter muris]MCB6202857.1 DMT family transporter [Extibacter muris]MCQ4664133.1 DMT family transporter [Extibacter muris]MCQ4692943.1 DMT family transporter [Extibacter muris]